MAHQQQQVAARDLDQAGSILIVAGVNAIKRNPIKVGFWLLGLLLFNFFNGFAITPQQHSQYSEAVDKIDYGALSQSRSDMNEAYREYANSRGWFWSCDARCSNKKHMYEAQKRNYDERAAEEKRLMSEAKSAVGLTSTYGIEEVRKLFWQRFERGRNFAKRQTSWDALFMGISAMGRDESFVNYCVRLLFALVVM